MILAKLCVGVMTQYITFNIPADSHYTYLIVMTGLSIQEGTPVLREGHLVCPLDTTDLKVSEPETQTINFNLKKYFDKMQHQKWLVVIYC